MTAMDTTLDAFWESGEIRRSATELIAAALAEDRATADSATLLVFGSESRPVRGIVTAEADGVVCGLPGAELAFRRLDSAVTVEERAHEGRAVRAGEVVLQVRGTVQCVLGAERTALNWLGYLSGIATRTARWVALAPGVKVLDTRKTLPGWRDFAKYAVRAGGGVNHRRDLEEFPMVKENHRDLFRKSEAGRGLSPDEEIEALIRRHRDSTAGGRPLEIEVEDYESFRACLVRSVDWILIDNQTPAEVERWLAKAEAELPNWDDAWRGRLEASGGVDETTIGAFAEAGVGRISIGALTHSVPSLDVSLHVEWADA